MPRPRRPRRSPSQLAGLKLLVLALAWRGVIQVMRAAVYAEPDSPLTPHLHGWTLGIPHLPDLMRAPGSVRLVAAWPSLYLELVWETLGLAAKGHVIVGLLRLFDTTTTTTTNSCWWSSSSSPRS